VLAVELYFAAANHNTGGELWRLRNGVFTRLTDLKAGYRGSWPTGLNYDTSRARLFFVGDNNTTGRELYALDSNGLRAVADIYPADRSSLPWELTPMHNGTVLFSARNASDGRELWQTDGTTATALPIRGGAASAQPRDLTLWRNRVFFAADDGASGNELWCSDGTAPGTVRSLDLRPGPLGSHPRQLTVVQDELYVVADRGAGRQILRLTDTGSGITVTAVSLGGAIEPHDLTDSFFGLLFTAYDATNGRELWLYDRTSARRLTQIGAGAASGAISAITPDLLRNGVWLRASQSAGLFEPFFCDLAGATQRVQARNSAGQAVPLRNPSAFRVASDGVICVGTHPEVGREIARLNPGVLATMIDIAPGADSSYPGDPFHIAGTVGIGYVFAADNGVAGAEPHYLALPVSTSPAVLLADLAVPPSGAAPEPEYHPETTNTALNLLFSRCEPNSPLAILFSTGTVAPLRNLLPNWSGDLYLNPLTLVPILTVADASGNVNLPVPLPPALQFIAPVQGVNLRMGGALAFSNISTSQQRECDTGGWHLTSWGDLWDDDKQYRLNVAFAPISGQAQVTSLWILEILLSPSDDGAEPEVLHTHVIEPGSLTSPLILERHIQVLPPPSELKNGHQLHFRVYTAPPPAGEEMALGCTLAQFYC
jgi:ELWxxDGT repeat protein